jgi:hypothetical protein
VTTVARGPCSLKSGARCERLEYALEHENMLAPGGLEYAMVVSAEFGAIQVLHYRPSRIGSQLLPVIFCPFCGSRIRPLT